MKRLLLHGILMVLLAASAPAGTEDAAARLQERLGDALRDLHSLAGRLDDAEAPMGDAELSLWLEAGIPDRGPLAGLGIQLLEDGEARAWAGHPFPLSATPIEGARLRAYGLFRILSLTLPRGDDGTWHFDLPLLRVDGRENPGPVLIGFAGLPPLILAAENPVPLDPHGPWILDRRAGDAPGSSIFTLGGQELFRLEQTPGRRAVPRRPLCWPGLGLFALAVLVATLARRRGSPMQRRWAGVLGLLAGLIFLRLLIVPFFAPAGIFSPRDFALSGWAGLLASPGDLLLTALAFALAVLLSLRSGDGNPAAPGPLGRLITWLLPALGLLVAHGLALIFLANSAEGLLFSGLLPGAAALVFQLGLFLLLLSWMLPLVLRVRLLARGWRPRPAWRYLAPIPAVLAAFILAGWATALALVLLYTASTTYLSRESRGAGSLGPLLSLFLCLAFLMHGAVENAQDRYLAQWEARPAPAADAMGQDLLLKDLLRDLGADRELRAMLQRDGAAHPGMALSVWSRSDLASLDLDAALAVYDTRGQLLDSHIQGLGLEPRPRSPLRAGGPDLRVSSLAPGDGSGGGEIILGEITLAEDGRPIGLVSLALDRGGDLPPSPPSLRASGPQGRLLASLGPLSLILPLLGLLLLGDFLAARFPALKRVLPVLLDSRGMGFRYRLLGAFLLAALLPTALIGFLVLQQGRGQFDELSSRASLERALASRRFLENQVRVEAENLAESEYVKETVQLGQPQSPAGFGTLERNQLMVFNREGRLLLDESLRDWSDAQADSFLAAMPVGTVIYERDDRDLYAGILVDRDLRFRGSRIHYSVYYRLRLTDELLVSLAEGIGGELSLYREGSVRRSNRPELFGRGILPPFLAPAVVRRMAEEGVPYLLGTAGGEGFGQALLPLRGSDGRPAAVLGSLDYSGLVQRREILRRGAGQVLALSALLVLLALGLGSFLAGRIFTPIGRLQRGTRRVAAGDFSLRLPEAGRDEIGELVASFNQMTERLEQAQEEIARKQRLEAWSEMARQVAHEIKNPLTPIKLSVQHMERAWRDKKPQFDEIFADTVSTLYVQVERLRRIARDFSSFGRSRTLEIETVDLAALSLEILASYRGSELELVLPVDSSPLPVFADREALRKVILNLVENAREAMEGAGRLELGFHRAGEWVELSLRDHGPGIPGELMEKLFEPYFSTKTSGTGLGLAICAQLVGEMKGSLTLENHPEGGVRSLLRLPAAGDE